VKIAIQFTNVHQYPCIKKCDFSRFEVCVATITTCADEFFKNFLYLSFLLHFFLTVYALF
jgi:hypothetical protein